MSQSSLFAIQLIDEIDSPYQSHSKDAKALGVDSAGNEYLLKRLEDGRFLPITEWLCHHLCRMAGIPTPEFSVVLRPNGEPAFGSKINPALIDFNRVVISQAQKATIVMDASASEAGALALDALLPNPDRHFGNWLYAARRNSFVALAIDWSRVTALAAPAFSDWPWASECNSARSVSILKTMKALDADAMRRAWAEIAVIGADDVVSILRSAPEPWIVGIDEDAILTWWRNSLRQRIDDSEALILT